MRSWLAALVLCVFAGGCATDIPIRTAVNASADPAFHASLKHAVLPADAAQAADPAFAEIAAQIRRTLTASGLALTTSDAEQPDVVVLASFGIEGNTVKNWVGGPTYGPTGGSTSVTRSTVTAVGNTAVVSAKTTTTPTYGVTGYKSVPVDVMLYTRTLILTGYDYRAFQQTGNPKPAWRTTMVSQGQSNDLGYVIPFMLHAGLGRLGKTLTQTALSETAPDDRNVQLIRSGGASRTR